MKRLGWIMGMCAAAAVLAGTDSRAPAAGAAATATQWCGSAAAEDKPDVVAGRQIHLIYATPSDGGDGFGTAAQAIAADIASMDDWWRRQDPARTLRFDLFAAPGCASSFGALDISRVSLGSDTAYYEPVAGRFAKVVREISARFSDPAKKYLVYYDGRVESLNLCGQATGRDRGDSGPHYGVMYIHSDRCGSIGAGDYAVKAAVHEILHLLGAVPSGAPHGCPADPAHTCENGFDVMHGLSYGFGGIESWVLDAGRDDYYAHSGPWFDVQDSLWLRRLDRQPQTLSVTLAPSASGAGVSSSVPGIDCPQVCSAEWDGGEQVELVASPGDDSRFVRWTGACAGQQQTCQVTMDRPQQATAVFGPLDYSGRIRIVGKGRVLSHGAGLTCTRTCTERFSADAAFAFRAIPAKGWVFAGWGGSCRGRVSTCRVLFDRDRTLSATFRRR